MKKKVSATKKSSKSVKKTAPRTSRSSNEPILIQRIVVITTCIVLALVTALVVNTHKSAVGQSVAGMSIANGLFSQATIDLPQVDGAVSFNIYYKKASENHYTNAVRNIPAGTQAYTISYLKKVKLMTTR
jgi:hypothetical protein